MLLAWEKHSLEAYSWEGRPRCCPGGGKQGVQPCGAVPSAASGSELHGKQVFSCLTYCKSCRLRNTRAAWVASMISSCPPANQPCWGIPTVSEILLGVAGPGEHSAAWAPSSFGSEHV